MLLYCIITCSASQFLSGPPCWASRGPAVENWPILSQGLIKSPVLRTAGAVTWWMAGDFLYKVIVTPLNIPVRVCVCVCVPRDTEIAFVLRAKWNISFIEDKEKEREMDFLRRLHHSGE